MIIDSTLNGSIALLSDVSIMTSEIIQVIDQPNALDVLGENLGRICAFDDFIVFLYERNSGPILITTNLDFEYLYNKLTEYRDGLYLLDPFYQKTFVEDGFFRLLDLSPEDYFISEYYNHFYKNTNMVDETRFILSLDEDTSLHVAVARAGGTKEFHDFELRLLKAIWPIIQKFCRSHFRLYLRKHRHTGRSSEIFDLREKIDSIPGSQLTPREIDTIELMLKGHSTKSMARVLNIDDGTVSNHKRNIYQKLNIHSQAQLFSLFLKSLTESNTK